MSFQSTKSKEERHWGNNFNLWKNTAFIFFSIFFLLGPLMASKFDISERNIINGNYKTINHVWASVLTLLSRLSSSSVWATTKNLENGRLCEEIIRNPACMSSLFTLGAVIWILLISESQVLMWSFCVESWIQSYFFKKLGHNFQSCFLLKFLSPKKITLLCHFLSYLVLE